MNESYGNCAKCPSCAVPLGGFHDRPCRRGVVDESLLRNAIVDPTLQRQLVQAPRDPVLGGRIEDPVDHDAISVDEKNWIRVRVHFHSLQYIGLMRHQGRASAPGRLQILLHRCVLVVVVGDGAHMIAAHDRCDESGNSCAAWHSLTSSLYPFTRASAMCENIDCPSRCSPSRSYLAAASLPLRSSTRSRPQAARFPASSAGLKPDRNGSPMAATRCSSSRNTAEFARKTRSSR